MLKLRHATEGEKEKVLSLYKSVIGLEGSVWDEEYPSLTEIDADFEHDCLYVLEKDGVIIGAISPLYENICDGFDCCRISDDTQREFARVVIGREHQGYGYGAVMTKMLLDVFKTEGCRSVHILVAECNISAQKTYLKNGFEERGNCEMFGHSYLLYEKIL